MKPPIVLSRVDFERLDRLLPAHRPRVDLDALREELDRARIVEPEDVPPDVVTMNSVVRFSSEDTGDETEVTLVYPGQTDFAKGQVSVLAPVGSALLGLAVGDVIAWPLPNGRTHRLRVVAVKYQPEAAGEYHR
jgi:regulator of nucleoside diphosphate kinase